MGIARRIGGTLFSCLVSPDMLVLFALFAVFLFPQVLVDGSIKVELWKPLSMGRACPATMVPTCVLSM